MIIEKSVSFIIPSYNSEKTIEECLNKILSESEKIDSEILVIDDCSTDKTAEIVNKFKDVKLFKLKKNNGVGYARNVGSKLAKKNILCYVDSDLIISSNSVLKLVHVLLNNKKNGTVGAIPIATTLNRKSWSSKFVGLRSSFGFEGVLDEIVVTDVQSEFFVIFKNFLNEIGGWKYFRNAGGEEFELGDRVNLANKRNIKIKAATYETYWSDLKTKFKKNIDRTEKYIHIIFERKKNGVTLFDSKGSSATKYDAFSALMTSFMFLNLLIIPFTSSIIFLIFLAVSFLIQIYLEFDFLLTTKKMYGFKMFFYSIYAIQIWNLGIFFGAIYFCLNLLKK